MDLIQLALAAEKLTQQQPAIRLSSAQCVRMKNVHAACERCVEICPTEAIKLGDNGPVLSAEQCIKCGACLHNCPVGAFERSDGLHKLLQCAENIPDRSILDIACAHHQSPDVTARRVRAVIQMSGCLSELGPSAYLGLSALGVEGIRVRLDSCDDCPLRILCSTIEHSITSARGVLSAFGLDQQIEIVVSDDQSWFWRKRPLAYSKQPPVSRRKLFTMFAPGSVSIARTITSTHDEAPEGKHIPQERYRLLNALRILAETKQQPDPATAFSGDVFASFTVTGSTCTACGLCERVCPTGALHMEKSEAAFAIEFAPHRCTVCGLCTNYCEPKALQQTGAPLAGGVLNASVQRLHEGQLVSCTRCTAPFARVDDDPLCPVCRHRQNNFGSTQLPKAMLEKLQPKARQRLEQNQTSSPGNE